MTVLEARKFWPDLETAMAQCKTAWVQAAGSPQPRRSNDDTNGPSLSAALEA
jgi:hypothetical protein